MKRTRTALAGLALLALLLSTFTSCASTHLIRWSAGRSSAYREHDTELGNAFLKPTFTLIALPVTTAWDAVTFPFQMIWGIYPWGERYLDPEGDDADPQ